MMSRFVSPFGPRQQDWKDSLSKPRSYTENMKFRIVLEFDADTNSYSAICPELPGCASAGVTEEEARANIEDAIRLYLAPTEILLPEKAKLVEVTIG